MLKHIYLILGATFLLGLVSGVVLYLNNNTGKEGAGDLVEESSTLSITAHSYGGCERGGGCASYRIENMRTYTYLIKNDTGENERVEGTLSSSDRRALTSYLEEIDFDSVTSEFIGTCPAEIDELAYRYTIMKDGENYTFDSCDVLLTGIPLFDTLEEFFETFAHKERTNE